MSEVIFGSERPWRVRSLLASSMLVILLASSAHASSSQSGWGGAGWALFALDDPSETQVLVETWMQASPGALGIHVLAPDGGAESAFMYRWSSEGALVALDHELAPTVDVDASSLGLGSGFSLLMRLGDTGPGFIVVWTAGGVDATDVSVTTATGTATLLDTGRATFFSQGEGMSSDIHAIARVGPASAGVQLGGELPLPVSGRFLGAVGLAQGSQGVGDQRITLRTASGETECPCLFHDLEGPGALHAGDHSVRRESLRAETKPTLVVAGADIGFG